jgi:cell division protein FtsI/penicillin-binding protein 2
LNVSQRQLNQSRGHRPNLRKILYVINWLGGGQALLFSVLVGRMYYLQVVQTDRFRLLAEENRVNLHLLPLLRVKIVDRFGTPLAINDPNYRFVIVPEQTANMRATLRTLACILPLSGEEIDRLVRDRTRQRAFLPITVKANLDWDMVWRVEVNLPVMSSVMRRRRGAHLGHRGISCLRVGLRQPQSSRQETSMAIPAYLPRQRVSSIPQMPPPPKNLPK